MEPRDRQPATRVSEDSASSARFSPAGLIGSLLLLAVVLTCLRLGFWQLDRRQQRIAVNQHIAARMELPPLASAAALDDTAAVYRRAAIAGSYDVARSIVLPGRSLMGAPGVHLVTPLRIDATRALLVNRGWVPAPDGATIAVDSFPITADGARGLLLPFPGSGSEPGPVRDALADSGFRRVWFTLDAAALRAQFPYELAPVMLQQLPQPGGSGYPRPVEPPALDQGPHLSYAIQWFSFAAIGVIGWLALLLRGRRPARMAPPLERTLLILLALAAGMLLPRPAAAQLRPLDPFDWQVLDTENSLIASIGAAALFAQPAPLAGSEGRLLELGRYRLLWRSGRFGLELSGTALWRYTEQDSIEPPLDFVAPAEDGIRQDAGPASVATFVRLLPARSPADVLLRFGARIPTTSDESGLERDETDFFALLGGRWRTGALALSGEAGVGIHGSVLPGYRQSDVLLYNFGATHETGVLRTAAFVVGRVDGRGDRIRGNEDQAELRLEVRAGKDRWVQAGYVKGISEYAPAHGLMIGIGFRTGCRGDCLP